MGVNLAPYRAAVTNHSSGPHLSRVQARLPATPSLNIASPSLSGGRVVPQIFQRST